METPKETEQEKGEKSKMKELTNKDKSILFRAYQLLYYETDTAFWVPANSKHPRVARDGGYYRNYLDKPKFD